MTPEEIEAQKKRAREMVAQTEAQGATPFAGSSFDTINSASLSGSDYTPEYKNPETPTIPEPTPIETQPQENYQLGTTEQSISDLVSSLTSPESTGLAGERAAYQVEQEQAAGLEETRKAVEDYTAQYNQLAADFKNVENRMQLQAEGRGITAGGLAPITMAEQRRISIQANTVGALLAAAQGKLTFAQSQVDRAVNAKFAQREADRKAKLENLEILSKDPRLSIEQKKRADAQAATLKRQEQEDAQKKANMTTIANWAVSAKQNGASNEQANAIMAIATSDNPDLAKAMQLYAPFASQTDKLTEQYKKLQIQKLQQDIELANQNESTVSPETLQGMLNVYKSTGVLPSFGMGAKSPLRAQFYAALGGLGGADIVNDANTNKVARSALQTALRTQENQLAASKTSIGTLDKQLSLAKGYSSKVDRSGSPILNKYILYLKGDVAGDADTAAFQNIVKTASYEFAKILSGAAASIAGVTVSSAADAENLLNSKLTSGQFSTIVDLMQKEAQFRIKSQQDTIEQLKVDLNNIGKDVTALPPLEEKTVKQYGQDWVVGQVYQDATGAKWTVDVNGKWSKQ